MSLTTGDFETLRNMMREEISTLNEKFAAIDSRFEKLESKIDQIFHIVKPIAAEQHKILDEIDKLKQNQPV